MGQLLVVRSKLPDFEVQPELIPDPVWNADSFASQYHNAGSGIRCCTLRDFNRYSIGRDHERDGIVKGLRLLQ